MKYTEEYYDALSILAKRLVRVHFRLNHQRKPREGRVLRINKNKCDQWHKIPKCLGIEIEWIGERI